LEQTICWRSILQLYDNIRICCTMQFGRLYMNIFLIKLNRSREELLKWLILEKKLGPTFKIVQRGETTDKTCMETYVNNIWTNFKPEPLINALPAYPCNKEHDHNLRNDNNQNFYLFNDRCMVLSNKTMCWLFTFKYYQLLYMVLYRFLK
jgi:hypothetical protein